MSGSASKSPFVPARAFSLVELLVAIAVIAVLVALPIPTLGAARRRADTTVCLTTLRSISQQQHAWATAKGDVWPNVVENRDPPSRFYDVTLGTTSYSIRPLNKSTSGWPRWSRISGAKRAGMNRGRAGDG